MWLVLAVSFENPLSCIYLAEDIHFSSSAVTAEFRETLGSSLVLTISLNSADLLSLPRPVRQAMSLSKNCFLKSSTLICCDNEAWLFLSAMHQEIADRLLPKDPTKFA